MAYEIEFKEREAAHIVYTKLRDYYRLKRDQGNAINIKWHHNKVTLQDTAALSKLEEILTKINLNKRHSVKVC